MHYKTVFVVTEKSVNYFAVLIPFVLLCVSAAILVYVIKGRKRVGLTGMTMLWFPLFGIFFAGSLFITSLFSVFNSRSRAFEALQTGKYKIVEGKIENFDPMPYGGHKNESFTVNGVFFEYSDFGSYAGMDGFNNTASHGGPITGNGIPVRLSYVTIMDDVNIILKLEIAND